MSELALQLIREAKDKQLECLDLGNCGLKELPNEVFELTWLKQINFGVFFSNLYSGEQQITENTGSRNEIRSIPLYIKNLEKLESLSLSANQIKDITSLKYLTNLRKLDLSGNNIIEIYPLEDLINLVGLNLNNNHIYDISSIMILKNLTNLNLSGNQIKNAEHLGNLTSLKELHISRNWIKDIQFINNLTNLVYLNSSDNQIKNTFSLQYLKNIIHLKLSGNKIKNAYFLKDLINLVYLDLSENQISNIDFLNHLTNLVELDLHYNFIVDVSSLKYLTKLSIIDLSNNKITDIEPIKNLIKSGISITINDSLIKGLILYNNPLTTPPREIIEQGNEAILRYFDEISNGTAHKINESRLLIVGQGGSGKTTLKRKLKDIEAPLPEPGDTTRGIETDILDYNLNNEYYKLRIWDFGGQNIQHYAHQFFLTDSSLYVLLSNEREQNANFQYWLNIIEMLGGKSPVLIVQNEIAGHCEPIKNLAGIRSRYENVVNTVYSIDLSKAKEDSRFEKLKKDILHYASGLEHVNKEYPASYVNVRNRLDEEVKKNNHFISWNHYKNICKDEGINNEALMRDIAGTYSVLGICLYIKDDIELRNYIFLNPQWIIDALFGLLYNDIVVKQNGEFSEEDTLDMWNEPVYENMHGKLIRMMERFELCYRIMGSNRFIVPQRLPAAKDSYNWLEVDTTKVIYSYQFMPKGIITRITCRLHEKIMSDSVWSDAVIFQHRGAKVFVREVYNEEKLAIEAAGNNRDALLNWVIDAIDEIHTQTRIANLKVEKLVPCICNTCATIKEPYFFNYDTLCLLLEEGEFDERCQKSRKKVDIREVLHRTGIRLPITHVEQLREVLHLNDTIHQVDKLKVFISYSKHDAHFKIELLNHLATLKRANTIITWNDADLIPSEDWDNRIKSEIANSQVILLLVSSNFIKTDYIWNVEVETAYKRVENGEKIAVVPIIVDFCSWENLPFAKNNVLPTKGEPVTNTQVWVNQNQAWKNVMTGIERVINDLKSR